MIKPYYDHNGITIIQGHVLNELPYLEPESVQMCVTSPPYWGLRDYGLPPQIWDSVDGCVHEWGDETISEAGRNDGGRDIGGRKGNYQGNGPHKTDISQGQFCQLCGAWRGSLGLEPTPELFIKHLTDIFREVRRVLKKDGVCFLNLGDSYASNPGSVSFRRDRAEVLPKGKRIPRGSGRWGGGNMPAVNGLKPKDLVGIPWRVALSLQADGWWLRSDIIWSKPNPMPESVTDRPTRSHEYLFLLTKSQKYYYDADAIREELAESTLNDGRNATGRHTQGKNHSKYFNNESPEKIKADKPSWYRSKTFVNPEKGRNKRSVWTIATQQFPGAHFAVFPEKLIEPCIKAGSRIGDTVLDPFGGSGTTARVAKRLNRKAILIDLNSEYCEMSTKGLDQTVLPFKEINASKEGNQKQGI